MQLTDQGTVQESEPSDSGERETVMRGERGPASIYCDLYRDEVKREQAARRAQAYRQRRRLST